MTKLVMGTEANIGWLSGFWPFQAHQRSCGPELVEHLIEALVHEADADGADHDAADPGGRKIPSAADDLEGQRGHRRIQGDDVERQSFDTGTEP